MATGNIKQIAIGDDTYNIYDATARTSINNIQKKIFQAYDAINSFHSWEGGYDINNYKDETVNNVDYNGWRCFGGGHINIKWAYKQNGVSIPRCWISDAEHIGSVEKNLSSNSLSAYIALGIGHWASHYRIRQTITEGNIGVGIVNGKATSETITGHNQGASEDYRYFFYNPKTGTYIQSYGPIERVWNTTAIKRDINYQFYHSVGCATVRNALACTYAAISLNILYFGIGN